MGLFDPEWMKRLSGYVKPDSSLVDSLDRLRQQYGLSHEQFADVFSVTPFGGTQDT